MRDYEKKAYIIDSLDKIIYIDSVKLSLSPWFHWSFWSRVKIHTYKLNTNGCKGNVSQKLYSAAISMTYVVWRHRPPTYGTRLGPPRSELQTPDVWRAKRAKAKPLHATDTCLPAKRTCTPRMRRTAKSPPGGVPGGLGLQCEGDDETDDC